MVVEVLRFVEYKGLKALLKVSDGLSARRRVDAGELIPQLFGGAIFIVDQHLHFGHYDFSESQDNDGIRFGVQVFPSGLETLIALGPLMETLQLGFGLADVGVHLALPREIVGRLLELRETKC